MRHTCSTSKRFKEQKITDNLSNPFIYDKFLNECYKPEQGTSDLAVS